MERRYAAYSESFYYIFNVLYRSRELVSFELAITSFDLVKQIDPVLLIT